MQRGLLRREQIELVLNANPGVDAGVALGHLAAAGYITTVQAETLRAAFWQHQGQRAQAVLNAAVQRGLLTPAHVQEAMAQYESVALQQTIGEFLVAKQMLTPAQAADLADMRSLAERVAADVQTATRSTLAEFRSSVARVPRWAAIAAGVALSLVIVSLSISAVYDARAKRIAEHRSELADVQADIAAKRADVDLCRRTRRNRTFIINRRFDSDPSTGKVLYEAVAQGLMARVVLAAWEREIPVVPVERALWVVSRGQREFTMTNSNEFRTWDTTEYLTVFETAYDDDLTQRQRAIEALERRETELRASLRTEAP